MTAPAPSIDGAAAARVDIYHLLGAALAFPGEAFHASVVSGEFRAAVADAASRLPFVIDHALPQALSTGESYVDFQAEYIRLFDVGMVRPPCPLYGGEWGMTRRATMEDALRFYRFFGLRLLEDSHELPDHITVELEFLQALAYMQGAARAAGEDEMPLLRAQRDFLLRHPAKWWPLLRAKLPSQGPTPFYDALTAVVDAMLRADLDDLRERLAS